MRKTFLSFTAMMIFVILFSLSAFGQNLRATAFVVEGNETYNGGPLYITVNGKKRKIAEQANYAWLINEGTQVVYAARDGAGGFEGEGQSLRIYDVKTAKTKKIMSEYTVVDTVENIKLSNGAEALLVRMTDGGLGGSYLAVVDPKRGQVLSLDLTEVTEIKGDVITVAFYKAEKWDAINDERGWKPTDTEKIIQKLPKVEPDKTETYDLKEVLKNKVMYNKTNEEMAREYEAKYKDVRIYTWLPKETLPDKEYFIMAYSKTIDRKQAVAPLRPTLELLFTEASKLNLSSGFDSAVFGMKFEDVILRNGTAVIKFSQPKVKSKMPSFAATLFLEAVEKTAKQFPTVKKVEVCEVGGTSPAFENAPQIPKCQTN